MVSIEVHPDNVPLFAGIAGATLGVDRFDVCRGLVLRKTYAHVMSPYVVAFRRPGRADRHHPGPWKSVRGGSSDDIEIEMALEPDVRPTDFDRVNTLWWLLALMRLVSGAPLKLPVISDAAFARIVEESLEPNLWPVETLPRQMRTVQNPPQIIDNEHLVWVQEAFAPGAKLMRETPFNRAFQAFDAAIWGHSTGSALIAIWAAVETLIAPGKGQISHKLASSVAALLEPSGPGRDRLFGQVKSLYEARGGSAHNSKAPEAQQLLASFGIARRCFMACIDRQALPHFTNLQNSWRERE